jgi:hypothetical protein
VTFAFARTTLPGVSVFRLNCPLVDMSPIAVEPDFTRKYLQQSAMHW